MFLGTVVERMARVLSHPMLILRPTETDNGNLQKYRKIIVACDMCIDPDPVIPMALTMAAENDTEFFLFHANASPLNTDVVDPTDAPYQQVQQTMHASQAQKLVTGIPAWARDRYSFETVLRPGRPDEALADYITENQPDLIVENAVNTQSQATSRWSGLLQATLVSGADSLANVDGSLIGIGEVYRGYRLIHVGEGTATFGNSPSLFAFGIPRYAPVPLSVTVVPLKE